MNRIFIDTNILVYAIDKDAGQKRQRAISALAPFYQTNRLPVVSLQVIHEFSYRLYRWGMDDETVDTLIAPMRHWKVVANDLPLYREGMLLKKRYQLSFWDSLILAAAVQGEADELWSEDLSSGQNYAGVLAVNPLL